MIENLRTVFRKEFAEMEDLAQKRKKKHKRLIMELARKVLKIRREKGFGIDASSIENRDKKDSSIDYEFELMMLDDFKVRSSDEENLDNISESANSLDEETEELDEFGL
jgi:hypothetical protein